AGVAVIARSLFRDSGRGKRRCPRCWYDMAGLDGLTCPECGRAARSERSLGRTRRRWRRAAAGLLVLCLGLAALATPWAVRHATVQTAPTTALLAAITLAGDHASALHTEILDELGQRRELAMWQFRWLVWHCAAVLEKDSDPAATTAVLRAV